MRYLTQFDNGVVMDEETGQVVIVNPPVEEPVDEPTQEPDVTIVDASPNITVITPPAEAPSEEMPVWAKMLMDRMSTMEEKLNSSSTQQETVVADIQQIPEETSTEQSNEEEVGREKTRPKKYSIF